MAALVAGTFVLFALIGRVLTQIYLTGNHGIRLANRHADPVAAIAGAIFALSFVVGLIIVGLDLARVWPVARVEGAYFNEVACSIGLLGVAIVVIAQLQMGGAWRIGVDRSETTHLVRHGLYRKSRNPIYFGIGFYWASLSALLPHPAIWMLTMLCWISIEVIVRKVEEPHLRQLHGAEFERYMQRSNRYLIG